MVPVYFLLVALPFAACGMPDMAQMNAMMQMMQQMEAAKGWGNWQVPAAPTTEAPALNMNTKEEYEAYLKWCAESRAREAEQAKQQQLLDSWKAREAARAAEKEKERIAKEAAERQEAQMDQWKMWEKQMSMSHSFDTISEAVTEMKHKYYYMVTFEFLKFCKCSDFTSDVGHFFNHEGFATNEYMEFDVTDLGLNAVQAQDPRLVAQALNQLSEEDQIKNFFGGLSDAMCGGARDYIHEVMEWEKTHHFLETLA